MLFVYERKELRKRWCETATIAELQLNVFPRGWFVLKNSGSAPEKTENNWELGISGLLIVEPLKRCRKYNI